MNIWSTFFAIALVIATVATGSAQHSAMPPGMTHDAHQAQMTTDRELKKRGASAMGFDQDAATHHFRLFADGGGIEVASNDPGDIAGRDQIRRHLQEIAAAFANGNFAKPFMTHGEVPPGVKTMQARKDTLTFQYEETPGGGLVRINTANAKARQAVHDFLRYQIREHATGDPLTVAK
jgi:hypothetical protein